MLSNEYSIFLSIHQLFCPWILELIRLGRGEETRVYTVPNASVYALESIFDYLFLPRHILTVCFQSFSKHLPNVLCAKHSAREQRCKGE